MLVDVEVLGARFEVEYDSLGEGESLVVGIIAVFHNEVNMTTMLNDETLDLIKEKLIEDNYD
jgi:hypothetical protein